MVENDRRKDPHADTLLHTDNADPEFHPDLWRYGGYWRCRRPKGRGAGVHLHRRRDLPLGDVHRRSAGGLFVLGAAHQEDGAEAGEGSREGDRVQPDGDGERADLQSSPGSGDGARGPLRSRQCVCAPHRPCFAGSADLGEKRPPIDARRGGGKYLRADPRRTRERHARDHGDDPAFSEGGYSGYDHRTPLAASVRVWRQARCGGDQPRPAARRRPGDRGVSIRTIGPGFTPARFGHRRIRDLSHGASEPHCGVAAQTGKKAPGSPSRGGDRFRPRAMDVPHDHRGSGTRRAGPRRNRPHRTQGEGRGPGHRTPIGRSVAE